MKAQKNEPMNIQTGTDRITADSQEALIAATERLLPALAAAYAAKEEMRDVPSELIEALDRAGAFRLLVPERLGGFCTTAETMTRIGIAVSRANPIAGWLVTVMNSAAWVASMTPNRMQRTIFGQGVPRMCASTNGAGTISKLADGSYAVNGSWHYCSGSHHAHWVCCPCVGDDGAVYNVAMPISGIRIANTWLVAGMRATGSDTVVAEKLRVSEEQFCTMDELWGGAHSPERQEIGELSDRWSLWPLMRAKLLGVLVGTAQGLLDRVIATKDKAILYTSFERRRDSSVFQAAVGECSSRIEAARTIVMESIREIDAAALSKNSLDYAACARLRGQIAVVLDLLKPAVDKLMDLLGSSAFADVNVAQRYWRDFAAGARHAVFHSDSHYEITGRQILGVEPNLVPTEMT